jgi:hypothetical protein
MYKKAIKSRTIWTLIAMFILGGVQNISGFIGQEMFVLVEGILLLLTGYFKLNPSQTY